MKRFLFLWTIAIVVLVGCKNGSDNGNTNNKGNQQVSPEFNADSAFAYVAEQCEFGPRTMNSDAHEKCAEYLVDKFTQFGGKVSVQEAESKLYDSTAITMKNIICVFNDSCPGRIQISSHWDSRPWADNEEDESLHNTPIDGANDGASGVGILLEIARQIQMKNPGIGIELVCWDAEDSGAHGDDMSDSWCLGSQYWAGNHGVEGFKYLFGILLDMVGGKDTYFRKEANSLHYAPAYVDRVWQVAQQLGYGKYFKNESNGSVIDDHLQVIKSGIPCIDIIGSDENGQGFPKTWHTTQDNINNIDKATLKAVGQTVMETIYTL